MARKIFLGKQARRALVKGVNTVADVVKSTLGAKGRNVLLYRGDANTPQIINDGVSIAREIILRDNLENAGALLINSVSSKTNDSAGDGTTTSAVLTQAIIKEGMKAIDTGVNPIAVRKGMERATYDIINELDNMTSEVTGMGTIEKVATISAGGDRFIGNLITSAMEKVGKEGIITLSESKTSNTGLKVVEGMQFDNGYTSSLFINNKEKSEVIFENAYILLFNKVLEEVESIFPLLNKVLETGKPLVIIASDFSDRALTTLTMNVATIPCVAIKAPAYGDLQFDMIEDLGALTGATPFSDALGVLLKQMDSTYLGIVKRIVVTKDSTTIIQPDNGATVITKEQDSSLEEDIIFDKELLDARIEEIKMQFEIAKETHEDTHNLKHRLAKLCGSVALIEVGAQTDVAMKEKKLRIEDALNATRAAVSEGIVAGGGVALLHVMKKLKKDKLAKFRLFLNYLAKYIPVLNSEEMIGYNIVIDALSAPIKQIAYNSGFNGDSVARKAMRFTDYVGLDASTGEFVNMLYRGIIDPTKVTKTALLNASSIASMLLTTEAAVVPIPLEEEIHNYGFNKKG